MAGPVKPKIETVVPMAMMPFDQLSGEHLLLRIAQVGKRWVINLAEDSREVAKFCDKIEREAVWREVSPSWDEFCMKAFGHPSSYLDLVRAGVALLDKGDGKPIPAEDARKAAVEARKKEIADMAERAPALEKHGGDQMKRPKLLRSVSDGPTSEYLVARIKRDRPDIAERMMKGEFKSVNEGARAAGISVRPSVKLGSPKTAMNAILRLNGREYVAEMVSVFIRENATPEFIAELRRLLDE